MAKMNSPFPFLGTLGEVSVYKNRLTDTTCVRMKGGPSKYQVKTYPTCAGIREQNSEFYQCGAANRNMFLALWGVKHLTDYVLAGEFTKIIKAIQCEDHNNLRGQREIIFSRNRNFLEGFQLNRKNPFDTVLSHPIPTTIDRSVSKAIIELPEVVPGINFRNPWPYSSFRFIIGVGAIADILYLQKEKRYASLAERSHHGSKAMHTDWQPADKRSAGQVIELGLRENLLPDEHTTMIVSVGIEFGTNSYNGMIPVKHVGCAKFVAVG